MLSQGIGADYIPIVNGPNLYVNGLGLIATTSPFCTINSGAARDSTNTVDIILNSNISVSAASNGVNGLDIGTIQPNTMYAVYVIGDITGNKPSGGIFSLNPITPTMPFGYNVYRRVGWIRTNGSSQPQRIWQTGAGNSNTRTYYYDGIMSVLTNGNATTPTSVSLQNVVPFALNQEDNDNVLEAYFSVQYASSSSSSVASFIRHTNIGNVNVKYSTGAAATSFSSFWMPIGTNSVFPIIDYETTSSSDAVSLWVIGFKDYI